MTYQFVLMSPEHFIIMNALFTGCVFTAESLCAYCKVLPVFNNVAIKFTLVLFFFSMMLVM